MPSTARLVRFRPSGDTVRATASLLYPLDRTYALAGLTAPAARSLSPDEMPEPYRELLVHDGDMTRTLERHFGGHIVIRTLTVHRRGRWYLRRVLLVQEYSGRPVEMGAIRIALDAFTPRVQAHILRGEVPLGRILREAGLDYRSRPQRFLEITPNGEMMGMFWMREPHALYGRQTVATLNGAKIGHIVEVLPLV